MSNSLQPHESQHARPPCPSPTLGVHPNPCPLSRWCYPTISSSVIPFSSCPQSFPASGSFPLSALHIRWPKYWSFSFNISLSNEHPGLMSFRMDWLDLLAVQRTRKSLLQHHSSKASILRHSAFFTVQLSHPYMTTGKTIALTRWTFFGSLETQNFSDPGYFDISQWGCLRRRIVSLFLLGIWEPFCLENSEPFLCIFTRLLILCNFLVLCCEHLIGRC